MTEVAEGTVPQTQAASWRGAGATPIEDAAGDGVRKQVAFGTRSRSHDDVAELADDRDPLIKGRAARSAHSSVLRQVLKAAQAAGSGRTEAVDSLRRYASSEWRQPPRGERSRLGPGAVRSEEDFLALRGTPTSAAVSPPAGAALSTTSNGATSSGMVAVSYRVFDMLEVARTLRVPFAALVGGLLSGGEHYAVQQQVSPVTSVDHSLRTVTAAGAALSSPAPTQRTLSGTYLVSLPDPARDAMLPDHDAERPEEPTAQSAAPDDDGAQRWVGLLVGLPNDLWAATPQRPGGRAVDGFSEWHRSSAVPRPAPAAGGHSYESKLLQWEVPQGNAYPTHAGFLVAVPPEPQPVPSHWRAAFQMLPQDDSGEVASTAVLQQAATPTSSFARALGADAPAVGDAGELVSPASLNEERFYDAMRRIKPDGRQPAGPQAQEKIVFATSQPEPGVPLCHAAACAAGRCRRRPSELSSVTVLVEPRPGDPSLYDPLSGVYLSVKLSAPLYAWAVALLACLCSASAGGCFARLRAHADSGPLAGFWLAQAAWVGHLLLCTCTLLTHRWSLAEHSFLMSRTGAGFVGGFGLLGGLRLAAWAGSFGVGALQSGARVSSMVLAALHPVFLLLWRAGRGQQTFVGEAVGVFVVVAGMLFAVYPGADGIGFGWSEVWALLSCVAAAGELLAAKVIAAQFPGTVSLFVGSTVGIVPVAIVAGAVGIDGASGSKGAFGWTSGDASAWWWPCLGTLCLSQVLFLHATRYMHPLAVSVLQCFAALLSAICADGVFEADVAYLERQWAIPGAVWVALAAMATAKVILRRRQIVECEVTEVQKRQYVRHSLTMDNLSRNQKQLGSRLYQGCEERLLQEYKKAEEERRRRREQRERQAAEAEGGAAEGR